MAVQAVNITETKSANKHKKNLPHTPKGAQPSFQGLEVIPVFFADALNNGGFITSFIAQDFFGMAGPRIIEGVNRRPVNPETGKKEGPYNWAFARREGIREILSGPSAFLIPASILAVVKKHCGTANNVPVDMIQSLGNTFVKYAAENGKTLSDVSTTKHGFYSAVYDNLMNSTFGNDMPTETELKELRFTREDFANRAIEIENARDNKKSLWKKLISKKVEGSPEDLTESFLNDYMTLRKRKLNPLADSYIAELTINPEDIENAKASSKKTGTSFKKLLKTIRDFSNDAIDKTTKAISKNKDDFNAETFLKDFIKKRTGSRIFTNMSMWLAVVAFYLFIPKLYSLGLKGQNPAFIHEQKEAEEKAQKAKENAGKTETVSDSAAAKDKVPFTGGLTAKTAEKVLKTPKLKKLLSHFEFDDASMSVDAMLALLFGFCLPPRLLNAPDKYDLKETILRDITSFLSILFAAKALSRGFSEAFSKISGLALNIKPENHTKGFWAKFGNYFSPSSGINVIDNVELQSKYVNVHEYKGGFNGFLDFVSGNGGNLKKMLKFDKTVAENTSTILGKDLKNVASDTEIIKAFKNLDTQDKQKAMQSIIDYFKNNNNKYVKGAKIYNSLFTFLSTIVLVPIFMIWLARSCDRMTRNARERDLALEKAKKAEIENNAAPTMTALSSSNGSVNFQHANVSMKEFLNK